MLHQAFVTELLGKPENNQSSSGYINAQGGRHPHSFRDRDSRHSPA